MEDKGEQIIKVMVGLILIGVLFPIATNDLMAYSGVNETLTTLIAVIVPVIGAIAYLFIIIPENEDPKSSG